ncbi:MAG: serine/threonine-protein kinase [Polyangia bacterium]|jgi:serine/threonine-protein kinase|nr:serine/threonine-protein kinase [Polyangia bacterium]
MDQMQRANSPQEATVISQARSPEVTLRRFGRYDLLLQIGVGGMASLHLARLLGPESFEKLVAIKKIHGHLTVETQFVHMFLDEARLSARIQHPNVVQIFELGEAEGSYYIAMEYVHGQNLLAVLNAVMNQGRRDLFDWSMAVRIVADAASGLHAAHELRGLDGQSLGIVHRDVSPGNLLISYAGFVKVVDFGIAWAAQKIGQTGVGIVKGKLAYMSPEQAEGAKVDRRTDVFALGIVLYEACCLKRLFRAETDAEVLFRVTGAKVPDPRQANPGLPEELARIIEKALAQDPANRFQSASEMQDALEQLLIHQRTHVGPAQVSELLETLFKEQRQSLDQRIRELLRASVEEEEATRISPMSHLMADAGETVTDHSLAELSGEFPAEEPLELPRRRWWAWVGIALLAAAALATAAYLGLRHDRSQGRGREPTEAPAVVKADAGAPVPRTVELVVRLTPKEAVLTMNGKEVEEDRGSYVRRVKLPRDGKAVSIQVSAPGYLPQVREVEASRDASIEVYLEKELAPARERPMSRTRRRRPGR